MIVVRSALPSIGVASPCKVSHNFLALTNVVGKYNFEPRTFFGRCINGEMVPCMYSDVSFSSVQCSGPKQVFFQPSVFVYRVSCNDQITYIHNWSLQPFSQNCEPSFSHHLCISGGSYSLKSTPKDRFLEKLFMANFICHSELLPEIG